MAVIAYGTLVSSIPGKVMAVAPPNVFHMPAGQVNLDFVSVGDVGNVGEYGGLGSVTYAYQIGKYDVTSGQYTAFLNAVATSADPYGLYHAVMAPSGSPVGIIRTSKPGGGYAYSVNPGTENYPVDYVSWGDAARFVNWLSNGQPSTGSETITTTERGSYTLDGATTVSALMAVTRNINATDVIPTVSEWVKAAYYKGGSLDAGFWGYPTQSDVAPHNTLSATDTNAANYVRFNTSTGPTWIYTNPSIRLTPVGAFAASPGAYGTYDMGGDVQQWSEDVITSSGTSYREYVGSSFDDDYTIMWSHYGHGTFADFPTVAYMEVGFRVALVPEPSCAFVAAITIALASVAGRRRSLRC